MVGCLGRGGTGGLTRSHSHLDNIAPTLTETWAGLLDPNWNMSAHTDHAQYAAAAFKSRKERVTYHFKVTCPFCTRFILKPTVGMELWHNDQSQSRNGSTIDTDPCRGRTYSIVNSPPCTTRQQSAIELETSAPWNRSPPGPSVMMSCQHSVGRSW